ncbi:MAG: MFS transporter [Caulobacterales bacterium]|nr:MFS transporter [Caulobacterales bacterium]
MTTQRRSALTLAAFAAPCLPLAALGLPLIVTLPEYYANELSLPLAAVGAAFFWIRSIDILFDPLMGVVMDRTRTRLGRFRPWLLVGIPLLMLAGWRLFFAGPGVTITHLWIWLAVAYMAFSICVLAQTSWGALLSSAYAERSRVYGFWQAANVIGIIAALLLAATQVILGAPYALGVQAMGWFIIVLAPLTILLAVWRVDEPPAMSKPQGAGFVEYLTLFKRDTVRRLMLVDLLTNLAPGIVGALFFFYFERVKGFDRTQTGILMLVYFVAAFVSAPLWATIAHKLGKHRALILNGLAYALVQSSLFLMPAGNMLIACLLVALCGLPYSAPALLLRSMLADVGDEVRLATGADRTGQFYALLAGTSKVGYALAVGITFPLLAWAGFDAAKGEGGLDMLRFLFIGLPGLLGLLSALTMIGYPLTESIHHDIRRALERRDD